MDAVWKYIFLHDLWKNKRLVESNTYMRLQEVAGVQVYLWKVRVAQTTR